MTRARSGLALTAVAAVVLIAAAGLAGYALRPVAVPSDLAAGESPQTAPATAEDFVDERSVQVRLTVGEPAQLVSAASGTLTGTWCSPAADIVSGTILATIDYAPIYAIHTDTPLYRSLGVDDEGEDVRVLQRELARLGLDVEETGYYGWQTARAVRDMKLAAGGADGDAAYRLESGEVVWLSGESLAVSECPAHIGQVVAPGEPLVIGPGTIQSIAIEPLPADLTDGERVLTVLGASGTVGPDGVSTDPQLLDGILQAPEAASVVRDPTSTTLPADIQLVTPVPTIKLPPAAVFGVSGDRGCIQSEGTVHEVTVIGASLGNSLVTLDDDAAITTVDLGAAIDESACTAAEQDEAP